MATVHLQPGSLDVRLTRVERVLGLLRDLHVPLAAVREARLVDDGLAATSGLRAPGLAVPGRIKVGTWRRRGARQYVAVRRGQPALLLALDGQRYDSVLVGAPDAHELAQRLGLSTR